MFFLDKFKKKQSFLTIIQQRFDLFLNSRNFFSTNLPQSFGISDVYKTEELEEELRKEFADLKKIKIKEINNGIIIINIETFQNQNMEFRSYI